MRVFAETIWFPVYTAEFVYLVCKFLDQKKKKKNHIGLFDKRTATKKKKKKKILTEISTSNTINLGR